MAVVPFKRASNTTAVMPQARKVGPPKGRWWAWRAEAALSDMDTLPPLEELAYRRILDYVFKTNDALRDDHMMPTVTKTGRRWKVIRASLIERGFIRSEDGFIRNDRASATCSETQTYLDQKRAAANSKHERPKSLFDKETGPAAAHADAHAIAPHNKHLTEVSKNTPLTPRAGGNGEDKDHLEFFEDLWRMWPKEMRKQKPRAIKAWTAAIRKLKGNYELIFDCLHRDITETWKDRKPTTIPYPSSWLNAEPWNDGDGEHAPESPQPSLI